MRPGSPICTQIFHRVISNWINDDRLAKINSEDYLNDEARMAKVAHYFEIESNGVLKGVIGTVDGWLVNIRRPTKVRDKVSNL